MSLAFCLLDSLNNLMPDALKTRWKTVLVGHSFFCTCGDFLFFVAFYGSRAAEKCTSFRHCDTVPPAIVRDEHLHYIGDGTVLAVGGQAVAPPSGLVRSERLAWLVLAFGIVSSIQRL